MYLWMQWNNHHYDEQHCCPCDKKNVESAGGSWDIQNIQDNDSTYRGYIKNCWHEQPKGTAAEIKHSLANVVIS